MTLALLMLLPGTLEGAAPGPAGPPPSGDAAPAGGPPGSEAVRRELIPVEPIPVPDVPRPLAGATDDPPPATLPVVRATWPLLDQAPGSAETPLDDVTFTAAASPAAAPRGALVRVPPLPAAATASCLPLASPGALPDPAGQTVRSLLGTLSCPPPLPDAPPVAFVVDTLVSGAAPRRTPGVMGVPVPVDADGRPTTGAGGVDVLVTALPRPTLDGLRLRVERALKPDALPFLGGLADLDLRVRLDLSGTPPGTPGPPRPFVDVGFRGGPPPHAFELEASWSEVGSGDALADIHVEVRPAVPRLTVLASFYTAAALDGPREPATDVAVSLDGMGSEGSRFTADFTLHQVTGPSPSTVLDWRASRVVDAEAVVASRRGGDHATTRIAVQGLPRSVGLSAVGAESLAIAFEGSAPVPRLEVDLDRVTAGGPLESTRVAATSLPRHAFLALTASGLSYRGSAPLGVVDAVTTDRGTALRLPGDHAAVLSDAAGRSVSARATGLRAVTFETAGDALRVHARLAAARPFDVLLREPGFEASLAIRDLPTDVEVRVAAGAVAYRADAGVASVTGTVAGGPLAVAFALAGLPERADVAFAPGEGRAVVTLSAPLGRLEVLASHAEGFANTSYRHARLLVEDFPGLAAAWTPGGREVEVQATPAGVPVGLVEVALSATGVFPSRPEPVHAVLDARSGREAVAVRLEGFLAARVRQGPNVTAQLDLAGPRPAGVTVVEDARAATLLVRDLAATVRLDTDLATRVGYQASGTVGHARLLASNTTSGDTLDILAEGIPPAMLLLLDPKAGTAALSAGAGEVGRVRVEAGAPAGFGTSGFRSIALDAVKVPGFTASWSPEGAAFATDGRPLGVVRAAVSTELGAIAPSSPTGDFVHVLDHTAVGGSQRIAAQVTGLLAARVRATPEWVEGGLDLAAPRPFDVVYGAGDPFCPAADVSVEVRDLPSFTFAADPRSFLDYQAQGAIGALNLTASAFARSTKGCGLVASVRAGVAGLPDALRLDWAEGPVSVAYRAAAPVKAIDLDLYDLRREVRRVIASVRDLAEGLALTLSPAADHAVFQASAPVGSVDVVASSLGSPAPPRDPALAHQFAYDQRADGHWLVYGKLTGLSGARFARTAGGVAATLEVAPGAFGAHVRVEGGPSPLQVVVTATDLPARTSLSTDGASMLHADFSAGIGILEITACLGNAIASCRTGGTFLFARAIAVPTRLHLDLTPARAEFDLSAPLDTLSFILQDPAGLDRSGAPGAVRQVRLTLRDLNTGHIAFGDPHAVVMEFGQPVAVTLLVTPIPDFIPPTIGPRPEAFVNVFLPATLSTPVAHVSLGTRPGEGVRAFRAILDESPARIEAELKLPEVAVMAWSAWDRVPASYLRIERPPASLGLEMGTEDPAYPLAGVTDAPGFYGDAWFLTPDRLRAGPADAPSASDWRLRLKASEDSGPVRFWLVTGGMNNRTREGHPDYVHVDLDRIPAGTSRVQLVTDPRVHDLHKAAGGPPQDGGFLAVDVAFAKPVVLEGSAMFGTTGVLLRPSARVGGDAAEDGTTSRLFFAYWQSFSTRRLTVGDSAYIPHVWAALRVNGTLAVTMYEGTSSSFAGVPFFSLVRGPNVEASFVSAHSLLFVTTDHNYAPFLGTTCWHHLAGATQGKVSGWEVWTLAPASTSQGCTFAI